MMNGQKTSQRGLMQRTNITSDEKQQVSSVNVGMNERYVSLVSGLALIFTGVRRGDFIGFLMTITGGYMLMRGSTGHDAIYKQLGVNTGVATNPASVSVPHQQGIHVESTVIVNRPIEQIYTFWRNFENLPQIMSHLEKVEVMEGGISRWTAKAPLNTKVSWDAAIITEKPYEVIGWRSLADAQIANAGSVRFRTLPGGQGTEIRVSMEYVPPAGQLGAAIARLLGEEPQVQIDEDLRKFKQLMESDALPTGKAGSTPSTGSMP